MIPLCRLILVSVWTVESVVAPVWFESEPWQVSRKCSHQILSTKPQLNHIWSNFSITGACPACLAGWLLRAAQRSDSCDPLGEQVDWRRIKMAHFIKSRHFLALWFSSSLSSWWRDRRVTLCCVRAGLSIETKIWGGRPQAIKLISSLPLSHKTRLNLSSADRERPELHCKGKTKNIFLCR